MTGDPPTTGEVVRRLDRLETTVLQALTDARAELREAQTHYVSQQLFREVVTGLRDDIDDVRTDITDVESEIERQAVSRRQVYAGAFLLLMGELLVLFVSLSNLAARTGGLMP